MFKGIAGRDDEEDAEGRIDPENNLQIEILAGSVPGPARRPDDGKRINPDYAEQSNRYQSIFQILDAGGFVHGCLLFLRKSVKPVNGSYREGILDYMYMLPIVKEVD